MLRVVLDTSVLVSNILVPHGVPAQVFKAWRAQSYILFTSRAIVSEFISTLGHARIRRKYNLRDGEIEDVLDLICKYAVFVPGVADVSDSPLRDPNDRIILSAAVEAEAHLLVSSDKDLLVLGHHGATRIVTPRQFLDEVMHQGHGPPWASVF